MQFIVIEGASFLALDGGFVCDADDWTSSLYSLSKASNLITDCSVSYKKYQPWISHYPSNAQKIPITVSYTSKDKFTVCVWSVH